MIPSPRQRLEEWGRVLPGLWRAVEAERARQLPDSAAWPAHIFLPLEQAGAATMAAIEAKGDAPPRNPGELSAAACTTQCLATWRMTQGIYRIDPTLYAALIETPITGDIPADVLLYLPEWCVYIETPGMTVPARPDPLPVLGLWYWLDWSRRETILCIGIDRGSRPPLTVQHVPLVGTIEAAIAATMTEWESALARGNTDRAPPPDYREAVRGWLPPVLSLVLYLSSRAVEIGGRGDARPGNPVPQGTRRQGTRLYPADGTRQWDVGVRLGAALRHAMASESAAAGDGGERHIAPHVRRAHWHTFLTGPRDAERRRDLRWLPPIPVAIEDYADLSPTIHEVRK